MIEVPEEVRNETSPERLCHTLVSPALFEAAAGGIDEHVDFSRVTLETEGRENLLIRYRGRRGHIGERFIRRWIEVVNRGRMRKGAYSLIREAEEQLEECENELRDFCTGTLALPGARVNDICDGLLSGRELGDLLDEEICRSENRIFKMTRLHEEAVTEEQSLREQLGHEEEYVVTSRVTETNPVVEELQQQLVDKQMELERLKVDSSARHPLVKRLSEEVATTKKLLESKERELIREERVERNPVYNDIALAVSRAGRERARLRAGIESLEDSTAQEKARRETFRKERLTAAETVHAYRAAYARLEEVRGKFKETLHKKDNVAPRGHFRIVALSREAAVASLTDNFRAAGWGSLAGAGIALILWGMVRCRRE